MNSEIPTARRRASPDGSTLSPRMDPTAARARSLGRAVLESGGVPPGAITSEPFRRVDPCAADEEAHRSFGHEKDVASSCAWPPGPRVYGSSHHSAIEYRARVSSPSALKTTCTGPGKLRNQHGPSRRGAVPLPAPQPRRFRRWPLVCHRSRVFRTAAFAEAAAARLDASRYRRGAGSQRRSGC